MVESDTESSEKHPSILTIIITGFIKNRTNVSDNGILNKTVSH